MKVHDSHVLSYEVNHKERKIIFRLIYDYPDTPKEYTDVIFHEIEGYQFYNGALGNIIFGFYEIPVQKLIDEKRNYLTEAYHQSGAPGPWASDLSTAAAHLTNSGAKAFEFGSSIGIEGWIVANRMEVRDGKA